MNKYRLGLSCGAALLLIGSGLKPANSKNYQVTGPVLDVTPTSITVQKGNDKWEIARTTDTKVSGDLKIGGKVTIYYAMVATEVDAKNSKSSKETTK